MRRILPAMLLVLACKPDAKALIVHKDKKQPTTPDMLGKKKGGKKKREVVANFAFMEHVGMVGMGSGIYLGDGYVLTSAHVGCFPFRMGDGSRYEPRYHTWRVLRNPDGGKSDLAIFQVDVGASSSSLAKLASLPIGDVKKDLQLESEESTPMIMVGTGFTQKDVPTTVLGSDVVLGYSLQPKRGKQWGINTLAQVLDQPVSTSGGYRTSCFITKFDASEGEAQAADGDSGGAMFAYNAQSEQWELVGCIIAVSQKGIAIPFGCKTYLGNLASYRSQLSETLAALGKASVESSIAEAPTASPLPTAASS